MVSGRVTADPVSLKSWELTRSHYPKDLSLVTMAITTAFHGKGA